MPRSSTRVTGKGQVVMPKPVREAANPIDAFYGCLKDLPGDPLADLEAEHQAEILAFLRSG